MTGIGILTVYRIRTHSFYLVVIGIAIGETVGHNQIEHIRHVESDAFFTFFAAFPQLIFFYQLFLSFRESQFDFTRFYVFIQVQINEQIIVAFQFHYTTEAYSGIIYRDIGRTDSFSIDHKLKFRVLHTCIPERRIYFINIDSCMYADCN